MKIPGPQARAVGVAFNDFASSVEADIAAARHRVMDGGEDGGITPGALAALQVEWDCYERPDFYDTWISPGDGGTRFIVQISPRPEVCFEKGEEIYGGGASYEIDARTFDILKKEMSE